MKIDGLTRIYGIFFVDSNGPVFMPNIRLLYELLRNEWETYEEEVEAGEIQPADPQVICIQKEWSQLFTGIELSLACSIADTTIPLTLALYCEEPYRYSLQSSRPLSLDGMS